MGLPLESNRRIPTHPTEDILEAYALHRLPESLLAPLEEHLLACESCRDALAEMDEFVTAMKFAASQPVPWMESWPAALRDMAHRTRLAPIVALVILAVVVIWKNPQESFTPVAVNLSSLRGFSVLAPATAGKPLLLSIDLPDLVPAGEYRAEVVDAAGRPLWSGTVSAVDGKLTAGMSTPLRNGVYWVRLYGANSELLREFGLSAK